MTAPNFASDPRLEERRRLPINPSPLTATETALIAHFIRACDLLDKRLTGARALEEETA